MTSQSCRNSANKDHHLLYAILLAIPLLFASACGGGGTGGGTPPSTSTITSVTISCASTSAQVKGTDQCTASVLGTNNPSQSVSWSVDNVTGGNSTVGTISSSGLFTAPAMVPSPTAITVAATSTADTTKSGSSSVTVTLSIAVSPTTTTVQLFHPQQFTATVAGVSNTAVNWEVNGNTGGNSSSGTVDTSGLYTPPVALPAAGSVTIIAVSQADPSQSASANVMLAKDSTAPSVTSTSPASGATAVSVQPSVQITFNEALDPATVTVASFSLTNGSSQQSIDLGYDASTYTVTLTPVGLLTPGASYKVQIAQSLHDLGGNALSVPYNFIFEVEGPTGLTGTATFPQGIDPTTTVVSSFRGQQSVPNSSGNFSATIATVGTTLLGSSLSTQGSALLAVGVANTSSSASSGVVLSEAGKEPSVESMKVLIQPGKRPVFFQRHQITASAAELNTSSDLVMDFQTTAEAVLFYSPALMNSDPQIANQILTDIAADPNTGALATALSAAWNESHPMQDSTVIAAYEKALQSILQTVVAQEPAVVQTQAQKNSARGQVETEGTSSTSQNYGTPQITPIDVCCINMPPFTAEGSDFASNFGVKFGRASGWFSRIVQMPSSFNPTQLQPSNGSSSNPDSPGPVDGEDQSGVTPIWLPGNSVFQYGDLLGDIGTLVSHVASDVSGVPPADSSNVTLPATTSAYYLVRFYSGGTGDPNEMPLVSGGADSIYAGQELWRSAMIANDMTVAVDLLNATNLIPSDIVTCEAGDLVPQIPTIASDVGFGNAGWSTFMQVSGDVWGSFAANFGSCFSSDELENVFGMLGDASKLATVGTIVDGLNSVSQASDAIQIVTEQALDSPVDTALIQVGIPAGGSVASITITPSALNISIGGSGTATATAYDSSNNPVSDASINWNIGDTSTATLSATGNQVQVTGTSVGTTQLTATAVSGASLSITVTVSAKSSGPSVGGVLPTPVPPSNSAQQLTINGTNFVSGATLTYYDTNGNAYPGHSANFVNSGQLVDPAFNNASDAGTWKVVVVNPGAQSSSAFNFTVSASTAAPSVSGVSPNPVPSSNGAQQLTINGTNFVSGATLTYYDPNGNAYPGHSATFVSSGQLVDPAFNNASDAGTWKVVVVNPGAQGSSAYPFTVSGSTTATLSITSTAFNPSTATVGTGYGAQQAMAATGGTTPYSWSISGQPSGMSMNASTGALFGTPTVSGTFNITVTVQDSGSPQQTASKVLTLTVQ